MVLTWDCASVTGSFYLYARVNNLTRTWYKMEHDNATSLDIVDVSGCGKDRQTDCIRTDRVFESWSLYSNRIPRRIQDIMAQIDNSKVESSSVARNTYTNARVKKYINKKKSRARRSLHRRGMLLGRERDCGNGRPFCNIIIHIEISQDFSQI